ncbi:MAG: hypothetical protein U0X39_12425 [Bacteroidales bacterium]
MRKRLPWLVLFMIISFRLSAQVQLAPNSALKSHETLEILKIDAGSSGTTFYMSVENRRPDGTFCADKNIYIIYPDGSREKMIRAEGIPVCPGAHRFTSVGEVLNFTLVFPPLKPGTTWFDLVEDCQDNCFWFYGVVVDEVLNSRIDQLFSLAASGKPDQNLKLFRAFLEETDSRNLGTEGMLYINIINSALEAGDRTEAGVWYKRLGTSGAPRAARYIQFLNEKGIKF